jgi:hypothetical protein
MSDRTVYAVVTLRDGEYALLPYWLDHYARLGVGAFALCVNTEGVDPSGIPDATAGIKVPVYRHDYHSEDARLYDGVKDEQEEAALAAAGAKPEDWVMRVDLDEFHQYPTHLHDVLDDAEASGYDALSGHPRERVAEGGAIVPLKPGPFPSLGEQYPWSFDPSAVYGGFTAPKVMLARGRVKLTDGRHHTRNAVHPATLPGFVVFHFKHRTEGLERVKSRMAYLPPQQEWYRQGHGGVRDQLEGKPFNLSDPKLDARPEGPFYYPPRRAK